MNLLSRVSLLFSLRDAMCKRDTSCRLSASVCPSVSLSVILVYCVQTVNIIKLFLGLPFQFFEPIRCYPIPMRILFTGCSKKVKVVDLYSASTRSISKAFRYSTHCQGITQFYLNTLHFIHKRDQLYLPLPSQPQLELIYRPRRDGRLS